MISIVDLQQDLWDFLFCIARAYDDAKNQADDVRVLWLSTAAMVSIAASHCENMHASCTDLSQRFAWTVEFLKNVSCDSTEDFLSKCNNTKSLFNLTCRYYNFIRTREGHRLTLYDDLEKEYDASKMNKRWWGARVWKLIHGFASNAPNPIPELYFTAYKSFIVTLSHLLPCKDCRAHLKNNLSNFPLESNLVQTPEQLFRWSFNLHNVVNKMLKQPEWSWERAHNEYFN